jgi:hypothetical protein
VQQLGVEQDRHDETKTCRRERDAHQPGRLDEPRVLECRGAPEGDPQADRVREHGSNEQGSTQRAQVHLEPGQEAQECHASSASVSSAASRVDQRRPFGPTSTPSRISTTTTGTTPRGTTRPSSGVAAASTATTATWTSVTVRRRCRPAECAAS